MKIYKDRFRDAGDHPTTTWHLRCAELSHASGYLNASTWSSWSLADWWVVEAEEIVDEYRYWRARPPHASRTRDAVDGYAFAAAWERSE